MNTKITHLALISEAPPERTPKMVSDEMRLFQRRLEEAHCSAVVIDALPGEVDGVRFVLFGVECPPEFSTCYCPAQFNNDVKVKIMQMEDVTTDNQGVVDSIVFSTADSRKSAMNPWCNGTLPNGFGVSVSVASHIHQNRQICTRVLLTLHANGIDRLYPGQSLRKPKLKSATAFHCPRCGYPEDSAKAA